MSLERIFRNQWLKWALTVHSGTCKMKKKDSMRFGRSLMKILQFWGRWVAPWKHPLQFCRFWPMYLGNSKTVQHMWTHPEFCLSCMGFPYESPCVAQRVVMVTYSSVAFWKVLLHLPALFRQSICALCCKKYYFYKKYIYIAIYNIYYYRGWVETVHWKNYQFSQTVKSQALLPSAKMSKKSLSEYAWTICSTSFVGWHIFYLFYWKINAALLLTIIIWINVKAIH